MLSIGGQQVATLTANSLGDVTYTIDTASLGLGAGNQPVSLQSMLITKTAQLNVK